MVCCQYLLRCCPFHLHLGMISTSTLPLPPSHFPTHIPFALPPPPPRFLTSSLPQTSAHFPTRIPRHEYRHTFNASIQAWLRSSITAAAKSYHTNATGTAVQAGAGDVGTDVSYNNMYYMGALKVVLVSLHRGSIDTIRLMSWGASACNCVQYYRITADYKQPFGLECLTLCKLNFTFL